MPESIHITINGTPHTVVPGTTVAAALLAAATPCRIALDATPRTALCGMGICFECRATVNGAPHTRTCQLLCTEGMAVETQR